MSHRRLRVSFAAPTVLEVEEMAALEGIALAPGEAASLREIVTALVSAANRAEEFPQLRPPLRHLWRDPGHAPTAAEDPFNAFIRCCRVQGAADGPLAGVEVGVKDNISVAGVPTTHGSRVSAHTPSVDAVVVERILDAGGTIVGKLNMDELGGGATGVMSAYGPARNPLDPSRSAGGSSGGVGAAVRAGAVDIGLAVDQGGSGRIPAAFCGLVAIKATHGLVPTFGVGHIDHTLDFVTPVTRTVRDAAVLLEVLAGEDWRDPQWVRGALTTRPYSQASAEGVEGMRIGVIDESVNGVACDPSVVRGIERSAALLEQAGATVTHVSIPSWLRGFATFQPLIAHLIANMIRSEGIGVGHLGYVDVDAAHAFAAARRAESISLNPYIKCWMIADRYLHDRYLNVSYGTLHNQRLLIRRDISNALQQSDLLLTPTLPITAPRLPEPGADLAELLAHSTADICFNTAPLNLSGHPAATLPSAVDQAGMPAGVQLIGSAFAEYDLFRALFVLEAGNELDPSLQTLGRTDDLPEDRPRTEVASR